MYEYMGMNMIQKFHTQKTEWKNYAKTLQTRGPLEGHIMRNFIKLKKKYVPTFCVRNF